MKCFRIKFHAYGSLRNIETSYTNMHKRFLNGYKKSGEGGGKSALISEVPPS